MLCPICSQNIKDDSKFCVKCGSKIPRCPTCGRVISRRTRFCTNDGTPIPEEVLLLLKDPSAGTESENAGGSGTEPENAGGSGTEPENAGGLGTEPMNVGLTGIKRRFCVQCGKSVTDGQALCASCRMKQVEAQAHAGVPPMQGQVRKKNTVLPVVIALAAIAIIAATGIGIIGYFVVSGSEPIQVISGFMQDHVGGGLFASSDDDDDIRGDGSLEADTSAPEEDGQDLDGGYDAGSEEAEDDSFSDDVSSLDEEEKKEKKKSGYILPGSDSRYLSTKDLKGLDAYKCRLARNELYARHGRKFDDNALQQYFNKCDWYIGTIEPEDFRESTLNQYEIANRDLIHAYEQKMGYQ